MIITVCSGFQCNRLKLHEQVSCDERISDENIGQLIDEENKSTAQIHKHYIPKLKPDGFYGVHFYKSCNVPKTQVLQSYVLSRLSIVR